MVWDSVTKDREYFFNIFVGSSLGAVVLPYCTIVCLFSVWFRLRCKQVHAGWRFSRTSTTSDHAPCASTVAQNVDWLDTKWHSYFGSLLRHVCFIFYFSSCQDCGKKKNPVHMLVHDVTFFIVSPNVKKKMCWVLRHY